MELNVAAEREGNVEHPMWLVVDSNSKIHSLALRSMCNMLGDCEFDLGRKTEARLSIEMKKMDQSSRTIN
eukprot:1368679-Amorphochlora_amoeboformis.AAC.1